MSQFYIGVAQYKKNGVFHIEVTAESDTEEKTKIIVPVKYSKKCIHGDTVVVKQSTTNPVFGYIQRVTARTKAPITGKLEKRGKFGFVKPLVDNYPVTFFVDIVGYERNHPELSDGDIVEVVVNDWKDGEKNPVATIDKKLISINADQDLVYAQGLPVKFPTAVLHYCTTLANTTINNREVLLHLNNFSIKDEKNSYSALSFSVEHVVGGYNMYVHTSDLTNLVTPGSALDIEAYYRGNSYDLQNMVISMLPERIEEMAALNTRAINKKPALTCLIKLSHKFFIQDVTFTKSYIKSSQELTIEEADRILTDGAGEDGYASLSLMNSFVKKLQRTFLKTDILPYNEVEFPVQGWVTVNNNVIPVREVATSFAWAVKNAEIVVNKLASAFLDNTLSSEQKQNVLYYASGEIEPAFLEKLLDKLGEAGWQWKEEFTMSQNLMDILRGSNYAAKTLVQLYLPKCAYALNQPNVTVDNKHYAQYTRPMSRYADIHTQRILLAAIAAKPIYSANLTSVCQHLNKCSRKKQLVNLLSHVRSMSAFSKTVNYVLNAVITNKTPKGYYVQTELPINGFIPLENLQAHHIGEAVRVKITERTKDKIIMQIV